VDNVCHDFFFISLKSVGETEINENIHYLHKFSTVGSVALYNLKFELAVFILHHWQKFEMNFFAVFSNNFKAVLSSVPY